MSIPSLDSQYITRIDNFIHVHIPSKKGILAMGGPETRELDRLVNNLTQTRALLPSSSPSSSTLNLVYRIIFLSENLFRNFSITSCQETNQQIENELAKTSPSLNGNLPSSLAVSSSASYVPYGRSTNHQGEALSLSLDDELEKMRKDQQFSLRLRELEALVQDQSYEPAMVDQKFQENEGEASLRRNSRFFIMWGDFYYHSASLEKNSVSRKITLYQ
jgi:hypothetical protein